jgi:hypothetical protein
LPWLIDLIGNRLNLFDTISWDDPMHLLLWALLTSGVLAAFTPRGLSRGLTTMVALGASELQHLRAVVTQLIDSRANLVASALK